VHAEVAFDAEATQVTAPVTRCALVLGDELAGHLALANVAYLKIGLKIAIVRIFVMPRVPLFKVTEIPPKPQKIAFAAAPDVFALFALQDEGDHLFERVLVRKFTLANHLSGIFGSYRHS
jgi:hypothetical protein